MSAVLAHSDLFFEGIKNTLLLTVIAGVFGLAGGLVLAGFRVSPVPVLRGFSAALVEIVRNTPITILFFFSAFVLPSLEVRFSYFTFAVLALIVYHAVLFSEAIRSGINSVAVGQAEAARAIGLTFIGTLRLIVLPQALRTVIPPMINVVIILIKNTAVASAFGVTDLLSVMELVASQESQAVMSILVVTAFIYLAMTIPAGILASFIERKVAFGR